MNFKLSILLLTGSINIYSNDLISSFNNLILNDLEFVQQTNINSKIDESVGKIYRKNNFIQVEILKPSKEKYIIKDNLIEVHDFDFNQISYIDINEQDSYILRGFTAFLYSYQNSFCSQNLEGDCPKLLILLCAHEDKFVAVSTPGVLNVDCLVVRIIEEIKISILLLSCDFLVLS